MLSLLLLHYYQHRVILYNQISIIIIDVIILGEYKAFYPEQFPDLRSARRKT